MASKQNKIMQKATDTSSLQDRIDTNKRLSENDFDAWTSKLLTSRNYATVLDLCCGTGNQILKYLELPSVKKITGVDVSGESLAIARNRVHENKKVNFIQGSIDQLDEIFPKEEKFDLVSCFYGLYYTKNITKTLLDIDKLLSNHGTILIVGPYGDNNKLLFDLLGQYFPIPKFVLESSTSFMEEEVVKGLQNKGYVIMKEYFVNKIRYPDVSSVMKYWQASTFYEEKYASSIRKELEKYFVRHDHFIVEKHIMALFGEKL